MSTDVFSGKADGVTALFKTIQPEKPLNCGLCCGPDWDRASDLPRVRPFSH